MKTKQLVTIIYGFMVIGAGIWRHLETGTSPQAVWFGIVMGALAFIGALLLSLKKRIFGYVLVCLSLLFVAGWFLQRMLSGHSDGTSIRVILILLACAAEAYVLFRKPPKTARPGEDTPSTNTST